MIPTNDRLLMPHQLQDTASTDPQERQDLVMWVYTSQVKTVAAAETESYARTFKVERNDSTKLGAHRTRDANKHVIRQRSSG